MKKLLFLVAAVILGTNVSNAQSDYTFAAGLGLDLFSGVTLVGPSAKYFFAEEHAGQAELMFESGLTTLTALYEYHGDISGADGLQWFAGAGPSILFFGEGIGTEIALRPIVGLDYKIDGVPLAFSFDWRPFIGLGDLLGNEVGAFGIGVRYVIE
ncbi:MAG: hypothetical protein ABJO28_18830 [Maribacter dokdonensis]|uniref:Uncharacterized protein n=1 Tax=Maribacter dokdonensis TaxID=320912 RepID=A0A1H4J4K6_9FLAO|nr:MULTISPECIES: hypothetical protein [Maribacter]HAF76035.1 hypothetical protein [Maribacter sp.]APA63329.1 hypothetical protein YQ22_02735 [Maribacter sp. 1_2014MBL_MicDiv]MBU2902843.1 hypothetical protein [Maribacter dokdonensis]PHN93155.1 hypothetical protein CSC80_13690 [Maribacter sp. 6B07]SEB40568.1 hypothetical protein SAMN05192540_0088 [Maribacter dokdonensis]|tara:strand:- start:382 stop:846 length:465 start_codon:yes stop_codon:yes gene_type:complete